MINNSHPLIKKLLITLVGHVGCHKSEMAASLNALHVERLDLSVNAPFSLYKSLPV